MYTRCDIGVGAHDHINFFLLLEEDTKTNWDQLGARDAGLNGDSADPCKPTQNPIWYGLWVPNSIIVLCYRWTLWVCYQQEGRLTRNALSPIQPKSLNPQAELERPPKWGPKP